MISRPKQGTPLHIRTPIQAVGYGLNMAVDTSWIPPELEMAIFRLARADQATFDLGVLSLEWSRSGREGPIDLYQVEEQPGTLGLRVANVRSIPPAISMLFSEAIHHLRACLDNTVFTIVEQLEGALTDRQARRVAMPVQRESSKLDQWFRENGKAGLSALDMMSSLAPRIRDLQPFASRDKVSSLSDSLAFLMGVKAVSEHPLLLLQRYSNEDKHRNIRTGAARMIIQRSDESFFNSDRRLRPVQRGDLLFTIPGTTPVEIDMNAAVLVQRPDGGEWVSPAQELDLLRKYLADVAIPTLITGKAIPNSFPPSIHLGDSGQTLRERIDNGTLESASQRLKKITAEAISEVLTTERPIVPTIRPE